VQFQGFHNSWHVCVAVVDTVKMHLDIEGAGVIITGKVSVKQHTY
jgi:hypothetical protein